MKKVLFLFVCLFTLQSAVVRADNDRPITVNQLPAAAQQFIKQYFPQSKVALAKMETDFLYKSYEVIFTDGCKVEFDKKGDWTDVDCKFSAVPKGIVPAAIQAHIQNFYPNTTVLQIERDRNDYEVKLSNRIELTFDLKFNLIDIDD
ncbi:MAG: PepSY-like domain-containing protein [Mediterranea sp.]|jgi:hypothetical protein|nr:PepSY-like domain-containing protein [Mediterranea sp.]